MLLVSPLDKGAAAYAASPFIILPESITFWCEIRTTKASAYVLMDLAQAKSFLKRGMRGVSL